MAKQRWSQRLRLASIILSVLLSIPLRIPGMSTLATPLRSNEFRITAGTCTRPAHPRPSFPMFPVMPNSWVEDTGPATSSSPETANTCWFRWVQVRISMILIPIPESSTGRMYWSIRPKGSSSRSTLPEFAIASEKPSTPSPQNCGARPTNAITSATILCLTM